jgi:glycosyltransferase involved in cell wall biosynthesis
MSQVCLVVPCFNEAGRLDGRQILEFLRVHDETTICFVDDGSSDDTFALLERLRAMAPRSVIVLRLSANSGKAEAVRQGVLHAASSKRFPLIGFWDADLSTPLDELGRVVKVFADDPGCTMAIGSRIRRLGARIERSAPRHYLGRVFSTCASLILKLPVYDSQCGAKVMRADIASVLFRERFLSRWLFDVELLARLRNVLGDAGVLAAVTEVPLRVWTEVGGSKLRLTHLAKVPMELARISRHYNRVRPVAGRAHAPVQVRNGAPFVSEAFVPEAAEPPVHSAAARHV